MNKIERMSRQHLNSTKKDDVGVIELWGDVYEDVPCDFWTGEPVEGDFITYNRFKEAMDGVRDCSTVELHLNSYGGDATVGLTIANLIKSSGQHIIGVNDGICASAAMTILSACDEVQTHKSSLFMIHQTMSGLIGYYNNEDLGHVMDCNNSYDKAAAEVYSDRTGLSKQQCLSLMKKSTWMTGVEALEKGFADSLVAEEVEDENPVELVNKTTLRVGGVEQSLAMFNLSDDFVAQAQRDVAKLSLGGLNKMKKEDLKDKLWNSLSAIFTSNAVNDEDDEEEDENDKVPAKDADEDEDENKANDGKNKENDAEVTEEEIQDRINSAVMAERERIQSIQKIADGMDKELVNEAMFGKTACDAGELALRNLSKVKEAQKSTLNNLQKDAEEANKVSSEPGERQLSEEDDAPDYKKIAKALHDKVNKIKEDK